MIFSSLFFLLSPVLFTSYFFPFTFLVNNDVPLVQPRLHANHTVSGAGLRKSVVDVGTQGVERDSPFPVPLRPRDLRPPQAAAAVNFYPLRPEFQRRLDPLLHRATVGNPPFKLEGDVLRNQLGVQLRLSHLLDVEID